MRCLLPSVAQSWRTFRKTVEPEHPGRVWLPGFACAFADAPSIPATAATTPIAAVLATAVAANVAAAALAPAAVQ